MVEQLEAMGHTVEARGGIGTAPTIVRSNGIWTAVVDPRTGGRASGF
jgi:gamma-glutamyltranspeptidase